MFTGVFTFEIKENGEFFIPRSMAQNICIGNEYFVFAETEFRWISIRFDRQREEGMLPVGTGRVQKNMVLRLPFKCCHSFAGRCCLVGVGDHLQLHPAATFEQELAHLPAEVKEHLNNFFE